MSLTHLVLFPYHYSIISVIPPKISMTEFRLTNFCTIFQKFLSLSSVIVQLICVLRLVLFSGYFLSLTFFSDHLRHYSIKHCYQLFSGKSCYLKLNQKNKMA